MSLKTQNATAPIQPVSKTRLSEERDTALSTTLMRGLDVLGCFQTGEESLSNSQVADRLGLNRPTVSRLCKTLIHSGFLRRDPSNRFRLAPKILTLSYPVLSSTPWRHEVRAMMGELMQTTRGSVTMSVISGNDFVMVQTGGIPRDFPHVPEIGNTGPLIGSAGGRALLSLLDETELQERFEAIEAESPELFARFHDKSIASIAQCRSRGFCVAHGDWRPTVVATSSPIGVTADGLAVTLTCSVPAYQVTSGMMENDLGPRIAAAAESMRQRRILET